MRRRVIWIVLAVLLVGGGFGLYWFQPWKLFTSRTVNEALPTFQAATPPPEQSSPAEPANALVASGMINSPAMVRGTCGKGRVLVSSPHPEQTEGLEAFAEKAVRWVAAKN